LLLLCRHMRHRRSIWNWNPYVVVVVVVVVAVVVITVVDVIGNVRMVFGRTMLYSSSPQSFPGIRIVASIMIPIIIYVRVRVVLGLVRCTSIFVRRLDQLLLLLSAAVAAAIIIITVIIIVRKARPRRRCRYCCCCSCCCCCHRRRR